jgi:hypothetical protein
MMVSANAIGEGIGGSGFEDSIDGSSEASSEHNRGLPSTSNVCSKTDRFGLGRDEVVKGLNRFYVFIYDLVLVIP